MRESDSWPRMLGTALAGCLALAGCVDRRLFITSDPPGARVYLNDQDVGTTPLEVDFTWFGTYDVRLHREGFEPLVTTREAKAPLHEVPPFDLAALLIPGTRRTHIAWHFELEPARVDEAALLGRARQLRARSETDGAPDESEDAHGEAEDAQAPDDGG